MARHSAAEIIQWTLRIDQHPPLYYLLLHAWMSFNGDTPYAVRMLSVLFGTATIPVMYLIGKRLSGAMTGLAAAAFLSFSLFNIAYAQETRMYTLLTLNAALAIYALSIVLSNPAARQPIGSQFRAYWRTWRTPPVIEADPRGVFSYNNPLYYQTGLRGWFFRHQWLPVQAVEADLAWVALIVFTAATMLSHNTAVFFLAAINIFVVGLMLYQRLRKSAAPPALQAPSFANWVKAQVGILILWSSWLIGFITQVRRVNQEFWIPAPTCEAVIQTLRGFLNPGAPGPANEMMTWGLCAVLCLGLVFYRKRLSILLFLVALFSIPLLGELLVSLRRPIFFGRTLIWITIPMLLLLAAGIAQLKVRFVMLVMLGVFAVNSLASSGDYYRYAPKEDWKDPAGYVANLVEKDDLILFNSAMVQMPFDYYFSPFEDKYGIQVEKLGVPDMFISRIPEPRMTQADIPRLISLLGGHARVWLVYSHDSYTDPAGLVPQTLSAHLKLVETREFFGSQVQLYTTP
jgi:hypothetical protein